ncbi:MAG: LPS export ABC transporter periplasmic protein LptC [Pseudomonadota bacterium]
MADMGSATRLDDDLWAPKRQLTLSQARRRSRRVAALRVALATLATVSLAVLLGHLAANAVDSLTRSRSDAVQSDEMVVMINPRFTGRDAQGRYYVITAETAERRRENLDLIDLVNPKLVDAEGSEVAAPSGLYDRANQTLDLYEAVEVFDSAGYTFTSTHARVHVGEDRVEGIDPLSGEGPLGGVRADTYEILENGDVVVLRGNVYTTIEPDAIEVRSGEAADDDTDGASGEDG